MKKPMYILLLSAMLVLFVPYICMADTVFIKNGDSISGQLASWADGKCVFISEYSAVPIVIDADKIAGLSTSEAWKLSYPDGDTVSGVLTYANGQTLMDSPKFGVFPVNVAQIEILARSFEAVADTLSDAPEQEQDKQADDKTEKGDSYGNESEKKEAPADYLNDSAVMTTPGDLELEFGFHYRKNRSAFSMASEENPFSLSSTTARRLEFSLGLRAGLLDNLEGWVHVPLDYMSARDVTDVQANGGSRWHLGDIQFGLLYQLTAEDELLPAISISAGVTTPTGNKNYKIYDSDEYHKTWLQNGGGHWKVSTGLNFVKNTDPAVIFAGIGYSYSFENEISGYDLTPGWSIPIYMGIGFAVNEEMSLMSRVTYEYITETEVDGRTFKGSSSEPTDLSFGFAYRLVEDWVISPEVVFALDNDAGQPSIGLTLSKKF